MDRPRSGIQQPDAAPVSSDTEIERIAPVLDALKADGIPSRSDVINPRRKPMPCRVVWPISMIFAVFQTLRSIRQLAKSSAKLVVMHSVQDGQADRREAPAGDIMDHIAAFFDAHRGADGCRYQTQPPCP